MRVLLVGTSYPSSHDDWKGRFIKDLVHALATRDALDLRLWAPPGEIPENVVNVLTADELEWLHRMLASGGIAHLLRTEGWKASGTVFKLLRLLRRGYKRSGDVDLFHVSGDFSPFQYDQTSTKQHSPQSDFEKSNDSITVSNRSRNTL